MAPAAGEQPLGDVPAPHADSLEQEPPVEAKSVKALTLLSLKRTFDLFVGNYSVKVPLDEEAQKAKIACKVSSAASFRLPLLHALLLQRWCWRHFAWTPPLTDAR